MAAGNSIAIAEDGSAKDAAGARVQVANINISGGVIGEEKAGMQSNIYGGGIASTGGTTWVGTSNIKVAGGTINGRVLEDGANTKGVAKATVGAGTLTIYKDFNFLKADAVIDGSGAESATLNFVNGYDFSKAEASEVALLDLPAGIVIKGFDINSLSK